MYFKIMESLKTLFGGLCGPPVKEVIVSDDNTHATEISQEEDDTGSTSDDKNSNQAKNINERIKSVKEILKENNAIWSRCKNNLRGDKGMPRTVFKRVGFVVVQTKTEETKIKFVTKAERCYKSFDTKALVSLPEKLGGIFEVSYDQLNLVDYEIYLEKVMLLHGDVLEGFLVQLRDHLEVVQQTMKEIDSWLIEPQEHLAYLKSTFGLETLEIPNENDLGFCRAKTLKECEIPVPLDFEFKGTFEITKSDSGDRVMLSNLLDLVVEE